MLETPITNHMKPSNLINLFCALPAIEKLILATLALVGSTPGKNRLGDYLRSARLRSDAGVAFTNASIDTVLSGLIAQGLVLDVRLEGFVCERSLQATALKFAMANGNFNRICDAVDTVDQVNFAAGRARVTNRHTAQMMLRMALLRQRKTAELHKCLSVYFEIRLYEPDHPYIGLLARPFDPEFFELLHPAAQKEACLLYTSRCV